MSIKYDMMTTYSDYEIMTIQVDDAILSNTKFMFIYYIIYTVTYYSLKYKEHVV